MELSAVLQTVVVIKNKTANHRHQGPIQPCHRVRINQPSFVESQMATVRYLYEHRLLVLH